MSEWFYYPVTEWGKEIAEKHTRDDGIRIDVHEVLRKLEPIWINTQEKAKKWDVLIESYDGLPRDIIINKDDFEQIILGKPTSKQKLEEIRGIITPFKDTLLPCGNCGYEEAVDKIIEVLCDE